MINPGLFFIFGFMVMFNSTPYGNSHGQNVDETILVCRPISFDDSITGEKHNLVLVNKDLALFLIDPFKLCRIHLEERRADNVKLDVDKGAMEDTFNPIHKSYEGDFYFDEVIERGRRRRIVRFSLAGERISEFSDYLTSGRWSVSPWGEIYSIQHLVERRDGRLAHLTRGSLRGELINRIKLSSDEIGSASGFIYGITHEPLFVNDTVVLVSYHSPRVLQFSREGKLLKKLMLNTSLIKDYVETQTAFKVKGAMSGGVNTSILHAKSAGDLIYITPLEERERILAFNLDGEMVASYIIKTEKPIEGRFVFDVIQDDNGNPVFVALINNEFNRLETATDTGGEEQQQ